MKGFFRRIKKYLYSKFQKSYYKLDYDDLNNFSIEFLEISSQDLFLIRKEVFSLETSVVVEDAKNSLFIDEAVFYAEVEKLMLNIENVAKEDFRDLYFEAKKENWGFNYFLSSGNLIYQKTLLVSTRLTDLNKQKGDLMYSICAIKKVSDGYYLWDLR